MASMRNLLLDLFADIEARDALAVGLDVSAPYYDRLLAACKDLHQLHVDEDGVPSLWGARIFAVDGQAPHLILRGVKHLTGEAVSKEASWAGWAP